MKKRILFMHQSSSIGGGSYCLLNLVKVLNKNIWEPVVALKKNGPLQDELRKIGVDVVFFPQMTGVPYNLSLSLRNLWTYWKVFRSEKACENLLQRERIEVLYLNNMMIAPYLRPAKRVGIKTVMHVREHWPLNEHKRQLEWIRNIVYLYCDKLIAINHYSASIFPGKHSTIVYDWINMSNRYKKMPLNEIFGHDMSGKKVLLYTGGKSDIKGPDYIVDAFTKYVRSDDYCLLMLGCESFLDTGWRHKVKYFLTYLGYKYWGLEIQKKVDSDNRIKGICGIYELNHLVDQSHCFVSYFRIPHANLALAENIILNKPCIAADTEEAREYSGNGKFACLVSPINDGEIFAEKLLCFLEEIEKWRKAAQTGSIEVAMMFDVKENADRFNKVIDCLL